jgi:hypothetical protein
MKCRIRCCEHNHSGRCDVRSMGRKDRPLVSASCQLAFKQRVGGSCDACDCTTPRTSNVPALVG